MNTQDKIDELRELIASPDLDADLIREIDCIGLDVETGYSLADAMREGSQITKQANGWGQGDTACALHAASISAVARGYLSNER